MIGQTTRPTRLTGLDGLAAAGAVFETPTLMLVQAAFVPGVNLVVGDLTEATYTGYAAKAALVANSAYVNSLGQFVLSFPSEHFEASGSTTPNDIYGWALVNAGKTAVYAAGLFDAPIPIAKADDGVDVLPEVIWGQ